MSVSVLVRRNVLDPYRSKSLWVLLGVFVLVFGLLGYVTGPNSFLPPASMIATIMGVLLPLAAFAYTYDVIAGPRERGSLRVLLSYPYSRREVVLGTLVGRAIVLGLAVVVGVASGGLATVAFGGSIDVVSIAIVLGLALVFATVLVGIGIGISASVGTTSWAAVLAVGAYLLFSGVWGQVPTVVRFVLNGFSFPPPTTPEWVLVWNQLSPFAAYSTLSTATLQAPQADAVYYAGWFGLLVLVAWFVLAVGIGTFRFARTDL